MVVGFFSPLDSLKPFLTIDYLKENIENREIRSILAERFENANQVLLKIIFKIETRFKVVNLDCNMIWVN
jgi:hypothetical protein